jgi:hypothetical protein
MRFLIRRFADRIRRYLATPVTDYFHQNPTSPDAASQLALTLAYRNMVAAGQRLPPLTDVGFKAFSQTDEDGILLCLFSVIGTNHKSGSSGILVAG